MTSTDAEGHRERLRARFRNAGAAGFSDHELLELLLTYVIPRRDVKPVARALLKECGDLQGVLAAPEDVLLAADGAGKKTAAFLRLIGTVGIEAANPARRSRRRRLHSAREAVDFVKKQLRGRREEEIHVTVMDAKNQPLAQTFLSQGTGDHVALYPRKALEFALSRRAVALLLAHNHPSGDPLPSEADRKLTKAVEKAAAAVGMRLLDHVIIGSDDRHYSFKSGRLV
jgi:DNA repair protein RadC